jgi:hypothetical protein
MVSTAVPLCFALFRRDTTAFAMWGTNGISPSESSRESIAINETFSHQFLHRLSAKKIQ